MTMRLNLSSMLSQHKDVTPLLVLGHLLNAASTVRTSQKQLRPQPIPDPKPHSTH